MAEGIEVNGDLSALGDVAGRDIYKIILQIVRKYVPEDDPLPQELEKLFEDSRILLDTLRAWKEVHNALDEVRSCFDQYREPVEFASANRNLLSAQRMRNFWRPVHGKVDIFTNRIHLALEEEQIYLANTPEHEYVDRKDDILECQKKGYQIKELSMDINEHLGLVGGNDETGQSQYEFLIARIKRRIGIKDYWWFHLVDMSDDFDNKLIEAMYLTDKILRSTAEKLYVVSRRTFGAKGK